jgi:hypothetical protein
MQMDDDHRSVWPTREALQKMLGRLDEERRARAQAPLATRLRHTLDAAAAQAMSGGFRFPYDNFPDLAAGSFLQLERLSWDEEARRGAKLDCYARALRELAGEAPEFADLADALDVLSSGMPSTLLRPRKLRRENKPPEYLELALYAVAAFWCAASELHKRDEKLIVDRVMAEVFGEARTGTEKYANNLGNPWLPLCGRTWDQARFLLKAGLSLSGRKEYQILAYVEAEVQPEGLLAELARRRSTLGDKAAADAAWKAAGVKRSRR